MPKLVDISDDADTTTKPLSRQTSVQSTKSVNSITSEVSENQLPSSSLSRAPSTVGATSPTNGSLSRGPSIKRDSTVSRSSAGGTGEQEPLIEQTETTELLSEL